MHNVRIRIFVLIASTSFAMAESPPGTAPSQLPPRTRSVENVVVPIPSEIFGSLEKFAHSNWRVVERPELADWRPHGNPEQIALLLGVEVAEGFIAVEAEDAAEVKSIGSVVLRLAQGLGVRGSVLRRSRSITEDASKNDWTAARKEWDGVLPDVKKGMVELKSDQLAQLVSLGGWLRGTEALSVLLLQDYSAEHAELLRQPVLLDYLGKQLAGMSSEVRTNPLIGRMQDGIREIRPLVVNGDVRISKSAIQKISVICEKLVNAINRQRLNGTVQKLPRNGAPQVHCRSCVSLYLKRESQHHANG
jgi:hypothetical protein